MFYQLSNTAFLLATKEILVLFFCIKILLKQYLINTNVTGLRKEHYFKFPMSHLKNANKQASEPSVTFHDSSYALHFFQKYSILRQTNVTLLRKPDFQYYI